MKKRDNMPLELEKEILMTASDSKHTVKLTDDGRLIVFDGDSEVHSCSANPDDPEEVVDLVELHGVNWNTIRPCLSDAQIQRISTSNQAIRIPRHQRQS